MHGMKPARLRAPDASPLGSPAHGFSVSRINASRRAAAFLVSLHRNRQLATAFPSPATVYACAHPIPGSMFPACCFAACAAGPEPVRPFAPPPRAVRPAPAASSLRPVVRSQPRSNRVSPASAPRTGILLPARINAFCRFPRSSVRLPLTPDLRSLPASVYR